MANEQSTEHQSLSLAMLGFAASAASTVFMDQGSFSLWAAPMGTIIFLACLHYEAEIPKTGPGGWAFSLIESVSLIMMIGWILNSLVASFGGSLTSSGGDKNYVQLIAIVAITAVAHWLRRKNIVF